MSDEDEDDDDDDEMMLCRAAVAGMQTGVSCWYENTPGGHLQRHRFLHVEILHSFACAPATCRPQGIAVPCTNMHLIDAACAFLIMFLDQELISYRCSSRYYY